LERVERDPRGLFKALPVRYGENAERAQADPDQSGGRIWQAGDRGRHLDCVVASRFNARESIGDLASEYGLKARQIEEAIRWE
jgi:hypothetical protein